MGKIRVRVVTYKSIWYYLLCIAQKLKFKRLYKMLISKPLLYRYALMPNRKWAKEVLYMSLSGSITNRKPLKLVSK